MAFPHNRRWPAERAPRAVAVPAMRGNKFNARKTDVDGIIFDSGKEANRYAELKILERAGAIRDLELQPKFWLTCGGKQLLIRSEGFPNGRRAKFTADFAYVEAETGERVVEDVKSDATALRDFKLRIAIVEAEYGVRVRKV